MVRRDHRIEAAYAHHSTGERLLQLQLQLLDPLGLNPEPKLVSNGAYVRENLLLRALVLAGAGAGQAGVPL
jgi:hypothetical protein